MMPSRGTHMLRGLAPKVARSFIRNYSLARSSSVRVNTLQHTASHIFKTSRIIASTQSLRSLATNSTAQTSTTSNLPDIDTLSLDDIDFSTVAISQSERIGYLKDIGLDFGWGPTSIVQWAIEHFHIWADLPWWGSIVAAAVTVRLAMFPFLLKSADANTRMRAVKSIMDPISRELREATRMKNFALVQEKQMQLKIVRQDAGIYMRWIFLPPVIQGVIGFGGYRFLSNAAALPVPGFYTGGISWFTDLTVPDGYLLLPAAMVVGSHLLIRFGGEAGGTETIPDGMRMFLLWGMPILVGGVTGFQSAALAVWFATTTVLSMLQALLLRSDLLRRMTGVTPKYIAPKGPSKTFKQIWSEYRGDSTQAAQGEPRNFRGVQAKRTEYTRPVYQPPTARPISKVIDTRLVDDQKQSSGHKGGRRR